MADIVFVPGFWHSEESVLSLSQHFEKGGHRFHTAPVRGHRSLKRRVRSVEAFLLNEEFETPPVVIGHGMGGLIAQQVSESVATGPLILVNSLAPIKERSWKPVAAGLGMLLFSAPSRIALPLPGWRQSCLEMMMNSMAKPSTLKVDADLVAQPVLVISGLKDNLIPPVTSLDLSRHYEQADFQGFIDQSHWMLENEYCDRVFHAMTDWLAALGISSETSTDEERSIREELQSHHERPRFSPSPKKVSPSKRSRIVDFSDHAGRLRGSTHRDSSADRGTVLPR